MGKGLGIAEHGNKAELGLELWLNWSLEDFPGLGGVVVGWGGGGGEKLGIKLKLSFSWGLGLAELDDNIPSFIFIQDIIRITMLMPYTSRGFNVLATFKQGRRLIFGMLTKLAMEGQSPSLGWSPYNYDLIYHM